jgi:hypothetical protein
MFLHSSEMCLGSVGGPETLTEIVERDSPRLSEAPNPMVRNLPRRKGLFIAYGGSANLAGRPAGAAS